MKSERIFRHIKRVSFRVIINAIFLFLSVNLSSFLHVCRLVKRTRVVAVVKQSVYPSTLQQQCNTVFQQFLLASAFMFSPG